MTHDEQNEKDRQDIPVISLTPWLPRSLKRLDDR